MTFTALEDNTTFTFNTLGIYNDYFGYSLDNGETWVNTTTTTPYINTGEKVLWKLDRINGKK